jgi:hypothetical protein
MKFTIALLTLLALSAITPTADAGLVRVAVRYDVFDITGGMSSPVGQYDGLAGFVDFYDINERPTDVDGDVLYDPTFHLGITYGQLRNARMLVTLGFRWTKIEAVNIGGLNSVGREGLAIFFDPKKPSVDQYDLDFNFNYLLMDITKKSFAPYVGAGFRAGFATARVKGFDTEYRLNSVLAGNFGAEVKLWEGDKKRSFLTLASVNSYDLFSSGDRPKYFNVGGALKYYFRP